MIWRCKQVTEIGFWPTLHFDLDRSNLFLSFFFFLTKMPLGSCETVKLLIVLGKITNDSINY